MKNSLPLMLLPGSLCNEKLFQPQIEYFRCQREVFVADLTSNDSIEAMAAQALNKAPQKFALAGLSMGGIVAMEIMRIAAKRVDRLALLDTTAMQESENKKKHRHQDITKVRSGGLASMLELLEKHYFPYYISSTQQDNSELKNTVVTMANESGVNAFVNHWQALAERKDYSQFLKNVRCKTLILCGSEDKLCPVELHEDMAKLIKNSQLCILDHCGHLSTLEKPDSVNRAINDWLNL